MSLRLLKTDPCGEKLCIPKHSGQPESGSQPWWPSLMEGETFCLNPSWPELWKLWVWPLRGTTHRFLIPNEPSDLFFSLGDQSALNSMYGTSTALNVSGDQDT